MFWMRLLILACCAIVPTAFAWEGIDTEGGGYVA